MLPAVAIAAGLAVHSRNRTGEAQNSMPRGATFRILLGVTDRSATRWDGSVSVIPGRVAEIRGWRFAAADSTDSSSSWVASTREVIGRKGKAGPVAENGVLVTISGDDANARLDVKTAQGDFSFRVQEIDVGDPKPFLDGKVLVDRVPTAIQLTRSTEEQDYPAIAQDGDSVWVSYVEFVHSDRAQESRRALSEAPKDFSFLARPAGGDQVFLMRYSKAGRTWGVPMAVSAPKQDVMRTAVAVDGSKRVWVIWSGNAAGNFDIRARSYSGGKWSDEQRLTTDPGTDLNPVAATDSRGRVWVAWQGLRSGNLEILAAAQNGERFTAATVVSFSKASDWDPSIATAPNGEVAIAWDTYDKGDYDVWFRRLRLEDGIKMDPSVPVAVSQNFEARTSIAYDSRNRVWIAYESSATRWGKDFGAYSTTGVALYQNHNVRVKCFEGTQAMETESDVDGALPSGSGAAVQRAGRRARVQGASQDAGLPNPELAKNRAPSATPQPPPLPLNSFPRIATDPSGAVYLTFRAPTLGQSPVGTIWTQQLLFLNGAGWKGPVAIPNSDYWLDARAAMLAAGPGELLLVYASDHRQSTGRGAAAKKGKKQAGEADGLAAVNADLYAAELKIGQNLRPAQVKAASAEKVAPPEPTATPERAQIGLMRNYRAKLGANNLQLMRGEFHRHTEMSGDGGRDGPVIDAYRYMIDAASMDWGGCCDHDNGGGREYSWWIQQKLTDAYKLGSNFVPMFSYERSVRYPEGHRNTVMERRGVRPLPRLPKVDDDAPFAPAPDTQMLYRYLRQFNGIVASHTSGTNMGTDWRDNDPVLEPVVEIYQGDRQNYEMPDSPRSNNEKDSIGGWRPLGFVSLALQKGYRLGFQASSDHISTHMSYCNLWVTSPTREGIMEAFHKRRVYGATDNIMADVRCGTHFMGEEFTTPEAPALDVKLWGTATFAKVHIIRDGQYVYSVEPKTKTVDFTWKDNAPQRGKTSYYYVRGEQSDGELVWVSPMWITYK